MQQLVIQAFIGLFLLVFSVKCEEDIHLIFTKIGELDEEIVGIRTKLLTDINLAKESLRSEFEDSITDQVRRAWTELLEGESIEAIAGDELVSQLRPLKQEHHHMKRLLHSAMETLLQVQKENVLVNESNTSDIIACFEDMIEAKLLRRDLEQCSRDLGRCSQKKQQRQEANNNLLQTIERFNDTCNATNMTKPISANASVERPTTKPAFPSETVVETDDRNRLIMVPFQSSKIHPVHQVNIHSSSIRTYPGLRLKNIVCLAYVAKLSKLLIGLSDPHQIVTSDLDARGVQVLVNNQQSFGLAEDEGRELVFLITHTPFHTISRMTTRGRNLSTIFQFVDYKDFMEGITVSPRDQKIYVINFNRLFMVTYDGREIRTLASGSEMHAVTIDTSRNILYYNDNSYLMKMSLSHNRTTRVTNLVSIPKNLIYYRNMIYHSSHVFDLVGEVDVQEKVQQFTLQDLERDGVRSIVICLVP